MEDPDFHKLPSELRPGEEETYTVSDFAPTEHPVPPELPPLSPEQLALVWNRVLRLEFEANEREAEEQFDPARRLRQEAEALSRLMEHYHWSQSQRKPEAGHLTR